MLKLEQDYLESLSNEELLVLLEQEKQNKLAKHVRQLVVKVLINGIYGTIGNRFFKLFNVEIARAITSNTRFYIHLLRHRIDEYLNSLKPGGVYVVYSDTDSVYFSLGNVTDLIFNPADDIQIKTDKVDKFVKEKIDPVIEQTNKEFSEFLNAYDSTVIKTEREAIADSGVFIAKKRYFMRVLDNEGTRYETPKIKRMGVEIVRSSTPKFSKDYLEKSIYKILDTSETELKNWTDNVKDIYTEQDLINIAKTSSVNSLNYNLDKVEYDSSGRKISIPINSRACLITNKYITDNNLTKQFQLIKPGEKVKFLYLKEPNPLNSNVFAFTNNRFAEQFRDYIDWDLNWEKFFLTSLEIMTNPLNYNLRKRSEDLDEW